MASTWLVLGGSPSAPVGFAWGISAYPEAITITTNSGILLHPSPHFYFLSDQGACRRFSADAHKARAKYGTILLTPKREHSALVQRGVDDFDCFLELVEPLDQQPVFVRGQHTSCRFSGLFALQVALNSGANHVILAGMDGYEGHGAVDSWDGLTSKDHAGLQTALWIAPFMQSAIDACPDVKFTVVGKPVYGWLGENLEIVRTE